MTTVVNKRLDHCTKYIGRTRDMMHFGNPFTHLDGDTLAEVKVGSRDESVHAFREWLAGDPKWAHVAPTRRQWILDHLEELRGQALGCYCKQRRAEVACHGDVYVEILEGGHG